MSKSRQRILTVLLGFVTGLLVGSTSIGAGSLIMLFLVALYASPAKQLVGQAPVLRGTLGEHRRIRTSDRRECEFAGGRHIVDRFDSRRFDWKSNQCADSGSCAAISESQ